jgi:hypothetical protein
MDEAAGPRKRLEGTDYSFQILSYVFLNNTQTVGTHLGMGQPLVLKE